MSEQQFKSIPLAQLAIMRRGITYSADMLVERDMGIPYINMKSFKKGGGFNNKGIKYYSGPYAPDDLLKINDLLIVNTDVTLDGDIVGLPAYLPDDIRQGNVLFSHHVTRLRLDQSISAEYLSHLLCIEAYRRWMMKYARGTTVLMLDMQAIKKIPITYPKSKAYQEEIAQKIRTFEQIIEKTEALIKKYQQIKAGLMHDLFTRGITDDGKLRPTREQAPELYQGTPIGWVPKEWTLGSLLDVTDANRQAILTGPFGADLGNSDFVDEGVALLRIGNVQSEYLSLNSLLYITEEKANFLHRYKIKAGDLLFARQGATTGRNCLADESVDGFLINYHIIRVALDYKLCSPVFIEAAFNEWVIKSQIERDKGRGTREGINTQQLINLKIPLPEVSEQREIGKLIQLQKYKIQNEKAYLAKLYKKKNGLMHDLLTGKVPVKVEEYEVPHV